MDDRGSDTRFAMHVTSTSTRTGDAGQALSLFLEAALDFS